MGHIIRKGSKQLMLIVATIIVSLSMFTSTSFAQSEGGIKTITNSKYTGISADIQLPNSAVVKYGYVNWYLGIGAAKVEGGISKTPQGYRVFLNTGYKESKEDKRYWISQPDPSIKDGDRVNIKLVNNGDKTVTMYVNWIPRYVSQPVFGTFSQYEPVKMVQGVEDIGDNSFSQASFSNVQLRTNTTGAIYKNWDGSVPSSFARHETYGSHFNVYSHVPLSASLR